MKLTPFETLYPIIHIFLRSLAVFLFLHLNLFPVFLVLSLLSFFLASLDLSRFIEQTLADAFHVRVRLDHFGEVVCRAREWELKFRSEGTCCLCTVKGLFVAAAFGQSELKAT